MAAQSWGWWVSTHRRRFWLVKTHVAYVLLEQTTHMNDVWLVGQFYVLFPFHDDFTKRDVFLTEDIEIKGCVGEWCEKPFLLQHFCLVMWVFGRFSLMFFFLMFTLYKCSSGKCECWCHWWKRGEECSLVQRCQWWWWISLSFPFVMFMLWECCYGKRQSQSHWWTRSEDLLSG